MRDSRLQLRKEYPTWGAPKIREKLSSADALTVIIMDGAVVVAYFYGSFLF